MPRLVDVLVIGGGIAGMSAAVRFARHGETVVLERESALGYHASGRSATFFHFGIGNDAVRGLTAASGPFFASPPVDCAETALWQEKPALFIADLKTMPALDALQVEMDRFTDTVRRVDPAEMMEMVPVLKTGAGSVVAGLVDTGGRKLDADALLQANAHALRRAGGTVVFDAEVRGMARAADRWIVDTVGEAYSAKIVVNAAGTWAD